MKKLSIFTLSVAFAVNLSADGKEFAPTKMVVKNAVVDVRSERKKARNDYQHDPLQETQLEFGEPVLVHEKKGGWARVECIQQPEFTHNQKWEGYPGWVQAKFLSNDLSLLTPLPTPHLEMSGVRQLILSYADKHLGQRYLWGGKSLYDPNLKMATGVDCSGLVHWAYRQVGLIVPRDSHEQYMKAVRVEPKDLEPADLLFLAKREKPEKIVHVALIADAETLLEAPQSNDSVRRISFKDRFGKTRAELKNGDVVGDRIIYFGSLLKGEK